MITDIETLDELQGLVDAADGQARRAESALQAQDWDTLADAAEEIEGAGHHLRELVDYLRGGS